MKKTLKNMMKETLKAGIQTVVAPQLFPTPPDIAARMVELTDLKPGQSVLEPSAGTGNIYCRSIPYGELLKIQFAVERSGLSWSKMRSLVCRFMGIKPGKG
jgi:phospholipid N-methyltransferase